MGRTITVLLFLAAASAALAAPFGAVRDSRSPGAGTGSTPAAGRPLGAEPSRTPEGERCQNLRRELRHIADRQREARTTGESDFYGSRYQQVLEQSSRAGC
jgi:hypothetical protein